MNSKMEPLDLALSLARSGLHDKCLDILLAQNPSDPRVAFNIGWHDIRLGDLRKGFEGLDAGRSIKVFGSPPLPGKMWRDEPLHGQTLLVNMEGGMGDEIINFRFCQHFVDLGASVVIACNPALAVLFTRQGFACVNRDSLNALYYDYWVPAMSLPYITGTTYGTLSGKPYIQASALLEKSDRKRIGVRWGGNVDNVDVEPSRKIPYAKIDKLVLGFPQHDFYSFQRDSDLHLGFKGQDLAGHMKSWEKTAELIASMDLMITSCTSVAHLSAAIGVPTWIMAPIMPYYTWAIPGDTSPWYESVRLFRQVNASNWEAPFDKLKEALSSLE